MHTTYDSIRDGARVDIEFEVLAKQTKTVGGEEVDRLLVTDREETEFFLLGKLESGMESDLEVGATVRGSSLLGAEPVTENRFTSEECPHCGETLRCGLAVDSVPTAIREAAAEFTLERTFGIVDEPTSLYKVNTEAGLVDDWNSRGGEKQVNTPDYVCENCGKEFDSRDLHRPDQPEQRVNYSPESAMADQKSVTADSSMGLATGGAKDINNFRDNIKNGYTPQPEAISDEGLFYDYYFETGEGRETEALFSPRYATAASEHPLTGETEQYLSVGLDSTLSVDEFERPPLDLVVVLDVSGSMSSGFDSYYYDEKGNKRSVESGAETKMEAATKALAALSTHLDPEDHFGVVLFNNRAHVAKPIRDVGSTDMKAIRGHIRDIQAGGGTNLADGFETAVDMLEETDPNEDIEQRVVFMTDMMPNTGETGRGELTHLFEEAAQSGIHTTFVGMGLDTNADLADELSGIRGANQYFVHSAKEFERRLDDEFEYMVTPLVYDLDLDLKTEGYEIEAVHGSPVDSATDGRLMHVGTLFPSAKEDGEARGGVVLVRLDQFRDESALELVASWTERDGKTYSEEVAVDMPDDVETYDHDGIRKAIVLTRYARILRDWSADVHNRGDARNTVDDWMWDDSKSEHERDSTPLTVSKDFEDRFERFQDYLEAEMEAVSDPALQQETDLLESLLSEQSTVTGEVVK